MHAAVDDGEERAGCGGGGGRHGGESGGVGYPYEHLLPLFGLFKSLETCPASIRSKDMTYCPIR